MSARNIYDYSLFYNEARRLENERNTNPLVALFVYREGLKRHEACFEKGDVKDIEEYNMIKNHLSQSMFNSSIDANKEILKV